MKSRKPNKARCLGVSQFNKGELKVSQNKVLSIICLQWWNQATVQLTIIKGSYLKPKDFKYFKNSLSFHNWKSV